ncbi:sulfurtransferase TusA family protein [Venatoribacter cucullus]|nr:sulfurtransferase TusA family protein [Venatoribacter cucullus]
MSNFSEYQQHLDASGLACPMPLLKTKLALRELSVGQVLLVTATDSGSWRDIRKYADMSGHELLAADEVNGRYQFLIRKGV